MHHIFISYARSEAQWVRRLVAALEREGFQAWLDQRDIPVTLPWLEEVRDAIVEADLFVACDSSAWRTSTSCNAEATIAAESAKQAITVEVDGHLPTAAARIISAVRELDFPYMMRTELAVLARDWDRAARPSGGLAATRLRRRLRAGASVKPPLGAVERAFLRASGARARRRLVISAFVALVASCSLIALEIVNFAQKRIVTANSDQASAYSTGRAQLQRIAELPFQGLAEAATHGGNESAEGADVIDAALRYPTPDDGFVASPAAVRFDSAEIAGTVSVDDGHGHSWRRLADAANVRHGVAGAEAGRRPTIAAGNSLDYRTSDSGQVEVLRGGRPWRHVLFSGEPSALRRSPDGRELAAVVGQLVEITNLQSGSVRSILRGSPGAIHDLAWAADGRRLWALSEGMVVSWRVRDGVVLVDRPGEKFEAIFPAANPSAAWVVGHDGELREIDIETGRTVAELKIPDTLKSGAGARYGNVAAVSGERGLWLVPLSGGSPVLVKLPGCDLGRPAFRGNTVVYLPCLSGQLLTVSVPTAKVVHYLTLDPAGVSAAKVMPASGLLLLSDSNAHLFLVSPAGSITPVWASPCGEDITRIAVSIDDRAIAPVGSGAGLPGCAARGLLSNGSPSDVLNWHFDDVDESTPRSVVGEAAAFSRGGRIFAYGFSDGTIVLHPTQNILPAQTISTVEGPIRDMYVTSGNDLLVATEEGIVQKIHLCESCLTNRALARLAAAKLQRDVQLGISRRVPLR